MHNQPRACQTSLIQSLVTCCNRQTRRGPSWPSFSRLHPKAPALVSHCLKYVIAGNQWPALPMPLPLAWSKHLANVVVFI